MMTYNMCAQCITKKMSVSKQQAEQLLGQPVTLLKENWELATCVCDVRNTIINWAVGLHQKD